MGRDQLLRQPLRRRSCRLDRRRRRARAHRTGQCNLGPARQALGVPRRAKHARQGLVGDRLPRTLGRGARAGALPYDTRASTTQAQTRSAMSKTSPESTSTHCGRLRRRWTKSSPSRGTPLGSRRQPRSARPRTAPSPSPSASRRTTTSWSTACPTRATALRICTSCATAPGGASTKRARKTSVDGPSSP